MRTSFKAPWLSVCDTKSHSWQQTRQQRGRSETGGWGGAGEVGWEDDILEEEEERGVRGKVAEVKLAGWKFTFKLVKKQSFSKKQIQEKNHHRTLDLLSWIYWERND